MSQFMGGFFMGLGSGFVQGFTDLLGIFDFAWDLLKKLFAGGIIDWAVDSAKAIQEWWSGVDIPWEIQNILDDYYNHKEPYEQGQILGEIFGYLVFEVILLAATEGAGNILKHALGKAPKWMQKIIFWVKTVEKKIPDIELEPNDKNIINEAIEEANNKNKLDIHDYKFSQGRINRQLNVL